MGSDVIDKDADAWNRDDISSILGLWVIVEIHPRTDAESTTHIGRFLGVTQDTRGRWYVFEGFQVRVSVGDRVVAEAVSRGSV